METCDEDSRLALRLFDEMLDKTVVFHALIAVLWMFGSGGNGTAAAQDAPVVEHLDPTSGPPGTRLRIVGRRFPRNAVVWLGDAPLEVEQVLPNRITVKVPERVSSGRVRVRGLGDTVTTGPEFRVTELPPPPVIDEIAPTAGPPGTHVVIRGRNFSPRLTRNVVTLGQHPAVVVSATPERLEVVVPPAAAGARFKIRVLQAGEATSPAAFRTSAGPVVTSISPQRGPPGSAITIFGAGFSANKSDNRVYLGEISARVVEATPDRLEIEPGEGSVSGPLLVEVQGGGRARSEETFTIQPLPVLTGFEPDAGRVGSRTVLRGTGFGNDPDAVEVKLGELPVEVTAAAPTRLEVVIPPGAETRRFAIRVHGLGPATSSTAFRVVRRVTLEGFTPRSGPAGTVVEIRGSGFDPNPLRNQVTVGGTPAEVLTASTEVLTVRVSRGPSGPIRVNVVGGEEARTFDPFVVCVPPTLESVSPPESTLGGLLTIRGAGFGTDPGLVKVRVGDTPLQVRSVKDDVIVARLLPGAATGTLAVTIPLQGTATLPEPFRVLSNLMVVSVHPERAAVGDSVVLRGKGFRPSGTAVEFGGGEAKPERVTEEVIEVRVPKGARSGLVTVRLFDGRSAPSPRGFVVLDSTGD